MKKRILLFFLVLGIATSLLAQVTTSPSETLTTEANQASDNLEDVYKVVEEMPMFSGCEDIEIQRDRKICSESKMLQFLYQNIKYPDAAKKKGAQGTVFVRFVIEADGRVTNPEVVRDIGEGCGAEALRVVKLMPNWNPGKQGGKYVRVWYNLPLKFRLE